MICAVFFCYLCVCDSVAILFCMLLARSFSVVEALRTLYTLKGMPQTAKDKASGAAQATQEKSQQLKENAAEALSHAGEAIKGAMGKVTGNNEGGAHYSSVLLAIV
ncbi:hypothetical protein KP509_1Z186000 [Ceratopteris richardii]|nr:hypothetical protein KP509_1Z186000 [Ceratopteris richardii]